MDPHSQLASLALAACHSCPLCLQNLATMFAQVTSVNKQRPEGQLRLFPRAAMAVTAASDNAPVHMDVGKAITVAEATGQRSSWAEVTPSSVLLLPFGQSVGAVADVMGVTYDQQVWHRLSVCAHVRMCAQEGAVVLHAAQT